MNSFVVKPGDTNQSELIRRIFATDDDQMPPEKSRRVLTAAGKNLLQRWVEQGAEYKPLWSFIPVEKNSVPSPTKKTTWVKNPIDDFVLAKLDAENLSPSPVTSRETLLRQIFVLPHPGPLPKEKEKRSQLLAMNLRLDWW